MTETVFALMFTVSMYSLTSRLTTQQEQVSLQALLPQFQNRQPEPHQRQPQERRQEQPQERPQKPKNMAEKAILKQYILRQQVQNITVTDANICVRVRFRYRYPTRSRGDIHLAADVFN